MAAFRALLRERDPTKDELDASAFAECLVCPARHGDDEIQTVRDLFERLPISVIARDLETAVVAAQLRAAVTQL